MVLFCLWHLPPSVTSFTFSLAPDAINLWPWAEEDTEGSEETWGPQGGRWDALGTGTAWLWERTVEERAWAVQVPRVRAEHAD